MTATKKTAARKVAKVAGVTVAEVVKAHAAMIPAPTVAHLEQALSETVALIEHAEAMAPRGIFTQQCQLAKVRAVHARELLEALKP